MEIPNIRNVVEMPFYLLASGRYCIARGNSANLWWPLVGKVKIDCFQQFKLCIIESVGALKFFPRDVARTGPVSSDMSGSRLGSERWCLGGSAGHANAGPVRVRSVDVSGRSGPGLPRLTPLVPISRLARPGKPAAAGPARRAGTADRRRQRLPCPLLPRLLIWPDGGQASQDCRLYLLLRPHSAPARRKPCTSAAPPRAWTQSCRRTDMQRGGLTNSSVLGGSGRPRVRGRGAPADFVRGAGRGAPISSGPRARGAGRRYRLFNTPKDEM